MRYLIVALAVLLSTASAKAQNYFIAADPTAVTVVAGADGRVAISAGASGGFSQTVDVVMPVIADVTFDPSSFSLSPGQSRDVGIRVASNAMPRTAIVTAVGSSAGFTDRPCPFTLTIGPAPDFTIDVSPAHVELVAGVAGGEVQVSAMRLHGFGGTIAIVAPVQDDIAFEPAVFTLAPGESARTVQLRASEDASSGLRTLTLSATAAGVSGVRFSSPLTVDVHVSPAASRPEIEAINPPGIVQGARIHIVRVTGSNFALGATVISHDPGLRIEQTRVLDASQADVALSATRDLASGGYRIDIRNPDGAISQAGVLLLVHPPESLGASLSVIAAAIVHPVDGSLLPTDGSVTARAFITATGTGVLTGTWRVDGVPFDRFTITAVSGEPVEMVSNVPIPRLAWGSHTLEVAIDAPRLEAVARIKIIASAKSASGLRLLAPEDRAVVEERRPLLRWSLVPGAEGYEVDLEKVCADETDCRAFLVRTGSAAWRLTERQRRELGEGRLRWRVRAIFPGDVRGEPTPWRTLTLTPVKVASLGPVVVSADPAVSTHRDLLATPMVAVDWTDGRDAHARAQLTTVGDLSDKYGQEKHTADFVWRAEANPSRFEQESRNWLVQAGLRGGRIVSSAGLTTPVFTTGAELLGTGLARMSVTTKIASRFGALSYYQPTDDPLPGSIAGSGPSIRALALELPSAGSSYVRLIQLRIAEDDLHRNVETFGLLASRTISKRLRVDVEAARGEAKDRGERRAGKAVRIGMSGTASRATFGLILRHTDSGWVNPANRGFSRGSLADRTSGDLSLSRAFGKRWLSLTMRRIESGRSSDSTAPRTAQTGGTAQFRMPLGPLTSIALLGNHTHDLGEAGIRLPATDRVQRGCSLTLQRSFGSLVLMQTIGAQTTDDRARPTGDREVLSLNASLSGLIGANVALVTAFAAARSRGGGLLQDHINLSVQPTFAVREGSLKWSPFVMLQRSKSLAATSETQQLRMIGEWSKPTSLFAFQLSGGWTRSDGGSGAVVTSREVQLALTLKKSIARGIVP